MARFFHAHTFIQTQYSFFCIIYIFRLNAADYLTVFRFNFFSSFISLYTEGLAELLMCYFFFFAEAPEIFRNFTKVVNSTYKKKSIYERTC